MIRDEVIPQKGFIFDIACVSEKGGRAVNEDSFTICHNESSVLISIADGLGAHGGGDIASKIAVDIAKKEYMELSKTTSKNICNIFQKIDDAIVAEQTDTLKMKTTLSCVLCRNKRIYASHMGDTRIYIFKNNKEACITADHSVAYEEVMRNKGTLDDIRQNPNRHILRAALGVGKIRPPDMFKQKIKSDLSVMICSDGFWEYVSENDMLEALEKTKSSAEWLEAMLKCHSEKADKFNDNYSAICLRIKKQKRRKIHGV